MESDVEKLVMELLQKSADTNKFIRCEIMLFIQRFIVLVFRSDSLKALEVMAENLSVYKTISTVIAPFCSNKNVVIRANIANIVDSVIVR